MKVGVWVVQAKKERRPWPSKHSNGSRRAPKPAQFDHVAEMGDTVGQEHCLQVCICHDY
jgi:hypothetical protein